VNSACHLAALLDFCGVTHVDDEGTVGDLLLRFVDRDSRHDGIRRRHQILDTFSHARR